MPAHQGKFVAYFRVSTDRQGKSGLSLEAQRKSVLDYLDGGPWQLVAEFTEIESGNPAHTDSDISVTIPEADILHCADTYWNGIYPFIDYSTGGNIDGMIKATDANVAAVTDKTIVIPGHGNPVSNKAELAAYRDMLVAIRDNVAKLKQEGRSLDETIAAKPTAAFDAKWGQFVITPALFTRLVYKGV